MSRKWKWKWKNKNENKKWIKNDNECHTEVWVMDGVADTEHNAKDVEERSDTTLPAKVPRNIATDLLIGNSAASTN